jgi:hypothetical protein
VLVLLYLLILTVLISKSLPLLTVSSILLALLKEQPMLLELLPLKVVLLFQRNQPPPLTLSSFYLLELPPLPSELLSLMLMLPIPIKSPQSRMVMLSFYPLPPPLPLTLSILNPS